MKIEIKDLYKEIKKNVILDNVNITLTGGKIYGIQGKNGCGKAGNKRLGGFGAVRNVDAHEGNAQ